MPFVDLYRVASAKRDVRTAFAAQMSEVPLLAYFAIGTRAHRRNLRPLIGPQVEGQKASPQILFRSDDQFDGFGRLNRSGKIDSRIQNAGSIAGFDRAAGWLGK